jgi:hypothetical protein
MSEKKKDLLKTLLEIGAEKPSKEVYIKRFDSHFTVQSVTYKEMQKLRERATYPVGKKGETKLNDEEFSMLIIETGVLEPNFAAPELVAKFGTPSDAIQELLTPGEIAKISAEIMELSGFGDEEDGEDEVKN